MGTWGLASAKAQFSEVVAKAMTEGPQEITRSGKDAVVVVSKKEWEERARLQPAKPSESLAEFLMNSPLRGSGLKIRRIRGKLRKVDL